MNKVAYEVIWGGGFFKEGGKLRIYGIYELLEPLEFHLALMQLIGRKPPLFYMHIRSILKFYGILYSWIYLSLKVNLLSQLNYFIGDVNIVHKNQCAGIPWVESWYYVHFGALLL